MARTRRRDADEDTGSLPVIIVPGWGAPHFHTAWIARQLASEGMNVHTLAFPRLGMGDMRVSAELLGEKVRDTCAAEGVPRVNLIGYSLGGLIARIYLQEFGGYDHLGRAVYVGAPQDGIYTAYPASFTRGGRQVRAGSAFMRELNRTGPCACHGRRCLSIYLSKDGIILPSKSARLPCGYNLKLRWPVFHWGIVFNRDVISTAVDFMRGRVPGAALEGSPQEKGGRC